MALIHEMKSTQTYTESNTQVAPSSTNVFFVTMSRQNLSALLKALQLIEHYWAGAGDVTNILEKRMCSFSDLAIDLRGSLGSGIPRSTPRTQGHTFISLPDRGLLRRFTTGKWRDGV